MSAHLFVRLIYWPSTSLHIIQQQKTSTILPARQCIFLSVYSLRMLTGKPLYSFDLNRKTSTFCGFPLYCNRESKDASTSLCRLRGVRISISEINPSAMTDANFRGHLFVRPPTSTLKPQRGTRLALFLFIPSSLFPSFSRSLFISLSLSLFLSHCYSSSRADLLACAFGFEAGSWVRGPREEHLFGEALNPLAPKNSPEASFSSWHASGLFILSRGGQILHCPNPKPLTLNPNPQIPKKQETPNRSEHRDSKDLAGLPSTRTLTCRWVYLQVPETSGLGFRA